MADEQGTQDAPAEPALPEPGTRLFQIREDDLAILERDVPKLVEMLSFGAKLDNAARVRIRRVQKVITDVRWNYGPVGEVIKIPLA